MMGVCAYCIEKKKRDGYLMLDEMRFSRQCCVTDARRPHIRTRLQLSAARGWLVKPPSYRIHLPYMSTSVSNGNMCCCHGVQFLMFPSSFRHCQDRTKQKRRRRWLAAGLVTNVTTDMRYHIGIFRFIPAPIS